MVVDGMQGGTAATLDVVIAHVGIPTLAALPQAVRALQELGVHREVRLIVSGGIRGGTVMAKALALGADAVIGTAATTTSTAATRSASPPGRGARRPASIRSRRVAGSRTTCV